MTYSSTSERRSSPLLLAIVLFACVAVRSAGGQYSIAWDTIDGGGGASAGATFSIADTIGQPDATGDSLSLDSRFSGGFWSTETVALPPVDFSGFHLY